MTSKIIRLPEVMKLTGLSRSSIYAKLQSQEFPTQIPLGERAVGWLESEIRDWIEKQVRKR